MFKQLLKTFCTKKPIQQNQPLLQIIKKAQQITITQQQIQKQLNNRLIQLNTKHAQTQNIIDSKLKFPIKLCGTNDKYQTKYGYLPQRIMSYYRIPKSRINQYLLKMYKASLYTIASRNLEYMNQYWEEGFRINVLQSLDDVISKNLQIKVYQDSNYLQQITESCQIIDSVMIRGLSMNRNQNLHPSSYICYKQSDDVGLITYTPKILTQNNQNFIDPKKNKNIYDGYDKMLLRVLVRIKSPLRLHISNFQIPHQIYTWEHLCIMENQMAPMKPLESSYKLQTLMEWLGKYRFGLWKVVDIDNFLMGNTPFKNYVKNNIQIDPILKGTKLDRSSYIDIRDI